MSGRLSRRDPTGPSAPPTPRRSPSPDPPPDDETDIRDRDYDPDEGKPTAGKKPVKSSERQSLGSRILRSMKKIGTGKTVHLNEFALLSVLAEGHSGRVFQSM
ncbi:hypothetical protein EDD21DRAFT_414177 [Dissophora ornata]|nr:hypothetical protein EDD21DRAFT_414177 [Dissophora ornata]